MNGIMKGLTAILGVMAVIACLATVGIIGYSMLGGGNENTETTVIVQQVQSDVYATPSTAPEEETDSNMLPIDLSGHIHDYEVVVEKKATCYRAGRLLYTCACGDNYYVDVLSTGHVADEWMITRIASKEADGLKVQKCIYCDEIIAQEIIYWVDNTTVNTEKDETEQQPPHVHQYVASVEREANCVLAGLRKYTCSCGNFYTEMIPAPGHVATDWILAAGATSTHLGTEQRTCTVCGTVLDSRPTTKVGNAAASASPAGTTSATTAPASPAPTTAQSSPAPTKAPASSPAATASSGTSSSSTSSHQHSYTSYVLKEANCTEKGVRSYVCSCGSEYAESIALDMNNHTYKGVVIPATATTQGYTVFTCTRCNFSYFDNYSPILGN